MGEVCRFSRDEYMLPQDWKDVNNPTFFELRQTMTTVCNELERHKKILKEGYLFPEEIDTIQDNICKLEYMAEILSEFYFEND